MQDAIRPSARTAVFAHGKTGFRPSKAITPSLLMAQSSVLATFTLAFLLHPPCGDFELVKWHFYEADPSRQEWCECSWKLPSWSKHVPRDNFSLRSYRSVSDILMPECWSLIINKYFKLQFSNSILNSMVHLNHHMPWSARIFSQIFDDTSCEPFIRSFFVGLGVWPSFSFRRIPPPHILANRTSESRWNTTNKQHERNFKKEHINPDVPSW